MILVQRSMPPQGAVVRRVRLQPSAQVLGAKGDHMVCAFALAVHTWQFAAEGDPRGFASAFWGAAEMPRAHYLGNFIVGIAGSVGNMAARRAAHQAASTAAVVRYTQAVSRTVKKWGNDLRSPSLPSMQINQMVVVPILLPIAFEPIHRQSDK
jgi:hypothetical protein